MKLWYWWRDDVRTRVIVRGYDRYEVSETVHERIKKAHPPDGGTLYAWAEGGRYGIETPYGYLELVEHGATQEEAQRRAEHVYAAIMEPLPP